MKRAISPKIKDVIPYLLCSIGLFIYLDYLKIFSMPPQGIHFMRQTDSLSIIIHYLKSGMRFWEPGILNLESVDGKTASEFPLFYYLIALAYQIFGEHESFLRILNTTIVFAGFYSVYKIARIHLTTLFASLALTFTLFGSMVVLYYANNFLPDATALGLTLIGISMFYSYLIDNSKTKHMIGGLLVMILASLLKVSYFVYPTACFLTLFYQAIWVQKMALTDALKQYKMCVLIFLAGVISVASWVIYIKHYNIIHNGYFLVRSRSILDSDAEDRMQVMRHVTSWWADSYYPTFTKGVLSAIFFLSLFKMKHMEKKWLFLSIISLLGGAAFFLLFFLQFKDHDYYFMALIPAIIIASIHSFGILDHMVTSNLLKSILIFLLLIVCLKGIAFSKEKLWTRYRESSNDLYSQVGQQLQGAHLLFDSLHVSPDAKVMIIIDRNVNGGLYFIRRFGWPIMDTSQVYMDRLPIWINDGATHILLLDSQLLRRKEITDHLDQEIFIRKNVSLYTVKK